MTKKEGGEEEINLKSSLDEDSFPGTLCVKLLDNDHQAELVWGTAF